MKAFLLFLLWVAVQFFIAYMQLSGFSNVSAFAHLGGAAVGVIFWLFTRNE
jgi:membrane associated rhomboid family serine protease